MALTNAILTLCSYNSQGLGAGKMEYTAKLLKNYDFIMLQETWLFNANMHRFAKELECHYHGISGMDENQLIMGRPFGGV